MSRSFLYLLAKTPNNLVYDIGEMSNANQKRRKTSNPARPPWHLKGKGEYIAKLRDVDELTFDEIGFKVGCSGEGARQKYIRWHMDNGTDVAA